MKILCVLAAFLLVFALAGDDVCGRDRPLGEDGSLTDNPAGPGDGDDHPWGGDEQSSDGGVTSESTRDNSVMDRDVIAINPLSDLFIRWIFDFASSRTIRKQEIIVTPRIRESETHGVSPQFSSSISFQRRAER
ncbi:MAG: hypothetical protein DRP45_04950 [Candidatus Zixiibacteriota bacterium]|nr:MAG: hypothetical protein DRP45_04950 [candidate division Zixibacteria bacterium]